MHPTLDTKNLKSWFLNNQRDFPWRIEPTPYKVWVSEIMLQQTRASVVIPYFLKWMQLFPSIENLASASLDEVIKAWEGLGYYSRARNLHEGAKYVKETHNGNLPENPADLAKIKGLGPYTVGAICSFAFHQRAAAVDGNVLRVLSRYFMIEDDISKPKTVKSFRELTLSVLPEKEPWIIAEALIELGATICTPKPQCGTCPLKQTCRSFLAGKATDLPNKSSKVKIEPLFREVAIIEYKDHLLIKRGEQGKIMSDLHEFPYFESTQEGMSIKVLKQILMGHFNCEVKHLKSLPELKQHFTRFRVRLKPQLFEASTKFDLPEPYQWISREELKQLAFSSGHKRIFQALQGFS